MPKARVEAFGAHAMRARKAETDRRTASAHARMTSYCAWRSGDWLTRPATRGSSNSSESRTLLSCCRTCAFVKQRKIPKQVITCFTSQRKCTIGSLECLA